MPVFQDGTFPTGAPILNIGLRDYKANSFSIDQSAETTQITDENGAHSGALSYEGPITGAAEVQYSSNAVPEPNVAAVNSATGNFTATIRGVSTVCFITGVSTTKPARGPWTSNLTWQAKKN